MKKCPVCGKGFTPKNPKGMVCSDGCRIKLFRARKEIAKYEAEEKAKKEARKKVIVRDLNQGAIAKGTHIEPKQGSLAWFLKQNNNT
jgi:predicted nucleic acid-binding Zn ribbon protein